MSAIKAEDAVKRVILLETLGVGCGPTCTCRAALAMSLTKTQSELLEDVAKGVVFDGKEPGGEAVVLAELGPSATEFQVTALAHIAEDKRSPGKRRDEKGGVLGAIEALMKFEEVSLFFMLERLVGGDLDLAGMNDDDIRGAAYSSH